MIELSEHLFLPNTSSSWRVYIQSQSILLLSRRLFFHFDMITPGQPPTHLTLMLV